MENMGWVKLHRQLLNSQYGNNLELMGLFSSLLLMANHKTGYTPDGTKIKPGQLMTSHVKLAAVFKTNRTTLRRKLEKLENAQQIKQQTSSKNTIITITNWHKYQASEQDNEHQANIKRTSSEHQVNTNKNDNNNKNNNNPYWGRLPFTPDDLTQLWNETMPEYGFPYAAMIAGKTHLDNFLEAIQILKTKDDWLELFKSVAEMPTLCGENDRGWKATLTWLIDCDNLVKVQNGNYPKSNKVDLFSKIGGDHATA